MEFISVIIQAFNEENQIARADILQYQKTNRRQDRAAIWFCP